MSLLKVNEVQNYNGSSLTLTASTVSTSAQLNTGGNISVTGSINVSDDSTTRSNLGLGSIATQNANAVAITGGTVSGASIVPDSPFSFRNKIINGNLKSAKVINQRGASSITGATGYTFDRWFYDGSTYLYQGIEDANVENGTYAISWVGSGINAAWKVSTDSTANNGPDATTGFSSVSNGDTFTVNEVTEFSKHLWIRFDGTLSNLDKVQVERDAVTPFEYRPISVELSLCKRYYEKHYFSATGGGRWTARDYTGGISFAVEKRISPTITFSGNVTVFSSASTETITPTAWASSKSGIGVRAIGSTVADGGSAIISSNSNNTINAEAEL